MNKREIKQLQETWGLDTTDIEAIEQQYRGKEQGENIVCAIYKDRQECAYQEAFSLGYATETNERYFDFSTFESDLFESDSYLELPSGKVVYLSY